MYFRRLLLSMGLLRHFVPRNDASVLQKSGEDSATYEVSEKVSCVVIASPQGVAISLFFEVIQRLLRSFHFLAMTFSEISVLFIDISKYFSIMSYAY